jgi:hypothetical protein
MTLEKRNEIINFIGWREINNTDTGNWCSSAGITRGNSRIRRKQSRNYIYLQDFKYKLIVTFNLIEDLRTICTLLYLVLWQILFVCLYINYRYDVTKYLLQFNCASDRQCWDFGLSFWTCVCRLEIASIEFLCGYKTLFLSIP